jgi:malonyl-CoA O-methyltransferase
VRYRLAFDSVREMFRYIKRSGVSGNRNLLKYKEMKSLMQNYPLDYLEFEVVFIQN